MKLRLVTRALPTMALVALATAAIGTASAWAAPEWYVAGSPLSAKPAQGGLGAKEESVSTTVSPVTLKVPGAKITISCQQTSLTQAKIVAGGTGSAAAISFKQCAVTEPSQCVVAKTITTGHVNSALFAVNSGEIWNQYSPVGGKTEPFAMITIGECSIEGTYSFNGTVCARETSPLLETLTKEEVFGGAPEGKGAPECAARFFGANAAVLSGTLGLSLSGARSGANWTGR
jgi:hypothetical protein